jgi:hypothetical protein
LQPNGKWSSEAAVISGRDKSAIQMELIEDLSSKEKFSQVPSKLHREQFST